MIWGTDVSIAKVKNQFKRFIENFVGTSIEESDSEGQGAEPGKIYLERLTKVTFLSSSQESDLLTMKLFVAECR